MGAIIGSSTDPRAIWICPNTVQFEKVTWSWNNTTYNYSDFVSHTDGLYVLINSELVSATTLTFKKADDTVWFTTPNLSTSFSNPRNGESYSCYGYTATQDFYDAYALAYPSANPDPEPSDPEDPTDPEEPTESTGNPYIPPAIDEEIQGVASDKEDIIQAIETYGGTVAEGASLGDLADCITNIPLAGYLADISTALSNLGITPPASYADLDTTITNSYNAILTALQGISGTSSVNPLQVRITQLEGYLDDIKTILTGLGLTPPVDYADLDTYISTAFSDILTALQDINGDQE